MLQKLGWKRSFQNWLEKKRKEEKKKKRHLLISRIARARGSRDQKTTNLEKTNSSNFQIYQYHVIGVISERIALI